MLRTCLPLLALSPLLPACNVAMGLSHPTVDGVELELDRVVELTVTTLEAEGFEVDSALGDVKIERSTDGATTITVQIYEKTLDDATATFANGKLTTSTVSGEPSAIGDVTVRTRGPLPHLIVNLGMGDVDVQDVGINGEITISTGMGDIEVRGAGEAGDVSLATGMGDLDLDDAHCVKLNAETGMGDIDLRGVIATQAELETGIGDVEVTDCTFDGLETNTGIGDIECSNTDVDEPSLHTGVGSASVE